MNKPDSCEKKEEHGSGQAKHPTTRAATSGAKSVAAKGAVQKEKPEDSGQEPKKTCPSPDQTNGTVDKSPSPLLSQQLSSDATNEDGPEQSVPVVSPDPIHPAGTFMPPRPPMLHPRAEVGAFTTFAQQCPFNEPQPFHMTHESYKSMWGGARGSTPSEWDWPPSPPMPEWHQDAFGLPAFAPPSTFSFSSQIAPPSFQAFGQDQQDRMSLHKEIARLRAQSAADEVAAQQSRLERRCQLARLEALASIASNQYNHF